MSENLSLKTFVITMKASKALEEVTKQDIKKTWYACIRLCYFRSTIP